jgi:hypothetical protein
VITWIHHPAAIPDWLANTTQKRAKNRLLCRGGVMGGSLFVAHVTGGAVVPDTVGSDEYCEEALIYPAGRNT